MCKMMMKNLLGKEPPITSCSSGLLMFSLVFTAAFDNDMREEVITEFCKHETKLRL